MPQLLKNRSKGSLLVCLIPRIVAAREDFARNQKQVDRWTHTGHLLRLTMNVYIHRYVPFGVAQCVTHWQYPAPGYANKCSLSYSRLLGERLCLLRCLAHISFTYLIYERLSLLTAWWAAGYKGRRVGRFECGLFKSPVVYLLAIFNKNTFSSNTKYDTNRFPYFSSQVFFLYIFAFWFNKKTKIVHDALKC